jgi:hypothetical protein
MVQRVMRTDNSDRILSALDDPDDEDPDHGATPVAHPSPGTTKALVICSS